MKLNKLKDQAWDYYKTWMREVNFCPILHKEIKVTRAGWEHITKGTKSKRRLIKDKYRRLKLLKGAKYIIRNASSTSTSKRGSTNYIILNGIFKEKGSKPVGLKVVLKKDRLNRLFFYSVMEAQKSRLSQTY